MNDTYPADLELFRKLGLDPFKGFDATERLVGRVAIGFDESYVDVFVKCFPAQAWRFECYSGTHEDTVCVYLRGGTGKLSDYWTGVELIARRLLVVENIERPNLGELEAGPAQAPGPLSRPSSLAAGRSVEH